MNNQANSQPAQKLVLKKQSIVVLSAPPAEQRYPTFDC